MSEIASSGMLLLGTVVGEREREREKGSGKRKRERCCVGCKATNKQRE